MKPENIAIAATIICGVVATVAIWAAFYFLGLFGKSAHIALFFSCIAGYFGFLIGEVLYTILKNAADNLKKED